MNMKMIEMRKKMLKKTVWIQTALGIQHFLVDAVCAACILGVVKDDIGVTEPFLGLVVLYNILAFCTQWFTGLVCDWLNKDCLMHIISTSALFLGTICCSLSLLLLGVIMIGFGNSLFHVAGGRYVIRNASGKSGPLGLFVAPGALGLFIGGAFAAWECFCAALAVNSLIICLLLRGDAPKKSMTEEEKISHPFDLFSLIALILILICICCRAASGIVPFPGKNIPAFLQWLPVLMIFAGKAWGGWIGDKLGFIITGAGAFIIGALLLACSTNPAGYITGQFMMNLLMPLTLWQMTKVIPRYPGLAFGLAATVLAFGSAPALLSSFMLDPINIFLFLSAVSLICFVSAQIIIYRRKI